MSSTRAIRMPMFWALVLILLGGCMQDGQANIPSNATLASSGDGHVSYTAPTDGTIWVYDVDHDRIDYSGQINLNQSIVVNPSDHRIMLDGRVVTDKDVSGGVQYRIFFLASASASARGY